MAKLRCQCDETRPECQACSRRGVRCSGYRSSLLFKDVSKITADASKRFESARWASIRREDAQRRGSKADEILPRSAQETISNPTISQQLPLHSPISNESTERIIPESGDPFQSNMLRTCHIPVLTRFPADDISTPGSTSSLVQYHESTTLSDVVFESTEYLLEGCSQASTTDTQRSNFRPSMSENSDNGENDILAASNGHPHLGNTGTEDRDNSDETAHSDRSMSFEVPGDMPQTVSSIPSLATAETLPMHAPVSECILSSSVESILSSHFTEHVVAKTPVPAAFENLNLDNKCFKYAMLALSAVELMLSKAGDIHELPSTQQPAKQTARELYSMAMQEMTHELELHGNIATRHLAGAALLLAYYEIACGCHIGIRNHTDGLNALLSKSDSWISFDPQFIKAWRMLLYDLRFQTLPTRRNAFDVDLQDGFSMLDRRLAIRNILSHLWLLHGRYVMETAFKTENGNSDLSASEQASAWLLSVLGRQCDYRHYHAKNFFANDLSKDEILKQCTRFERLLDEWHSSLAALDLPQVELGSAKSFWHGSSFDTIIPFNFRNNDVGFDFALYLISRLICGSLKASFDHSAFAPISETWGKSIVSTFCGLSWHRDRFTLLGPPSALLMTALLSEGSNVIKSILYGLIPRVEEADVSVSEAIPWRLLKKLLKFQLKEKSRGRNIRFAIAGVEDSADKWQIAGEFSVAVFGDDCGKRYFRDTHYIDDTL